MRNHTVHQTRPAPGTERPMVRGANAIDRYSLALQLIQVYPTVLAAVAIALPLAWLQIVVAALGLAIWTLWAILRERGVGSAGRDGTGHGQAAAEKVPITTAATTEAGHDIRLDIWLHPRGTRRCRPVARRPHHVPAPSRVHWDIPREAPPTSSESCRRAGT